MHDVETRQDTAVGVKQPPATAGFPPKKTVWAILWEYRYLYLLAVPGLLVILIFQYGPMPGIAIAFQDFSPSRGLAGSEWVGFQHFQRLLNDPKFWQIFRNSIVLSLIGIVFLFPAPIILALLINEVTNQFFKRTLQTIYYLPHFLSWVIVASLTYLMLSTEIGLVNKAIVQAGGQKIPFLLREELFYPTIVIQSIWKEVGWGTIIYLAAIAGVSPTLYEAARVDGANKLQQIWYITLPGIMPTITILFILNVGALLSNNFEQVWLMQNALNLRISEVIDTYVYKTGVQGGQFSYTTAVGLFKSVIGFGLIMSANWYANKRGYEGIW
jgi:putative aldouronate transport system permease protein